MTKREISLKNDLLRQSIPYVSKPNMLVLTRGIVSMGLLDVDEILKMVRDFDNFNSGNDPYKEHDFGHFEYKGKKIYWKIDNYQGQDGYELVLTVMLAEEY